MAEDQISMAFENKEQNYRCKHPYSDGSFPDYCKDSALQRFDRISGGFGGFNRSKELTSLAPDNIGNEFISFSVYVYLNPLLLAY
jgi:hypothetical protein